MSLSSQLLKHLRSSYPEARVARVQCKMEIASREEVKREADGLRGGYEGEEERVGD